MKLFKMLFFLSRKKFINTFYDLHQTRFLLYFCFSYFYEQRNYPFIGITYDNLVSFLATVVTSYQIDKATCTLRKRGLSRRVTMCFDHCSPWLLLQALQLFNKLLKKKSRLTKILTPNDMVNYKSDFSIKDSKHNKKYY